MSSYLQQMQKEVKSMQTDQIQLFDTAKEIINQNLVKHIAIIMDGNRRWAKQRNLPSAIGHNNGRKTFKNIVKHSAKLGLKYLTTYAFSTENWGRDKDEVSFLMDLLIESLKTEIKELSDNNVKLTFIGRRDRFNSKIQFMLEKSENDTSNNTGLNLQLALDYGSRDEITNAIKEICMDITNHKISAESIDENLVSSYLYTKNVPDPDLMIRTGGELRLSNYLLWQSAYSELYVTDTFWPDFSESEFEKAIVSFANRNRRWGKD